MKTITINPVEHRGFKRLVVMFSYDEDLIKIIKEIKGSLFSATLKSWHVPDNSETLDQLHKSFRGKAIIDAKTVYAREGFFAKQPEPPRKRIVLPVRKIVKIDIKPTPVKKPDSIIKKQTKQAVVPSTEIIESLDLLRSWMRYRRYSDSSIETYCDGVRSFLMFISPKSCKEANNEDMVRYVNEYLLERNLSFSYQNQIINGCKIFFREIIKGNFDIDKLDRPRRQHKLPNVLSKQEVAEILQSLKNIKHRTMLSLIYACGLRRSELINLKPADIDNDRYILIIRQAKGRKDRIAPISEKTIKMLQDYYKAYKPKLYMFEGQVKGEKYSEASLQEVLKTAIKNAGITKPVTLHWLRHSYATHLLESGVDLRYIQELLGHKSSRTTEIYTHVSTKSLQKIISPFDSL